MTRPPIVVVMGHIDHGKSKILETIRNTKMLELESGGITQHIGAYEIEHHSTSSGQTKRITFIDTPGHETFSKMRSRGAKVADIAILVVAADEGVKPQTKEAIEIIRHNSLPYLVALNKIDKPEANPERVTQQLAEENVLVESYGGKIPMVAVSAKTGEHLDDLLETILLLAELDDLRADPEKPAEGVIIETHRDPKRGITATLLVRDGTITKEHFLVMGRKLEKIKILEDFREKSIESAGPSSPILIAGISESPTIGDTFRAFSSREDAEYFLATLPEETVQKSKGETITTSGDTTKEAEKPIFNIIVKADVAGSQEALAEALQKLSSDTVGVRIIKSEVGDINESDVKLARATKLVTIVGFKVRVDPVTRQVAEQANIHILTGELIHDLLEEVKKQLEEMIPLTLQRIDLGKIKILKVFRKDGAKQIVGGRIEEGIIRQNTKADIKRNKELIGSGMVLQVQRERQDVNEAGKGSECGMMMESKTSIQEGDILESYQEEMTKQTL